MRICVRAHINRNYCFLYVIFDGIYLHLLNLNRLRDLVSPDCGIFMPTHTMKYIKKAFIHAFIFPAHIIAQMQKMKFSELNSDFQTNLCFLP